jgi:hypothetical protein
VWGKTRSPRVEALRREAGSEVSEVARNPMALKAKGHTLLLRAVTWQEFKAFCLSFCLHLPVDQRLRSIAT